MNRRWEHLQRQILRCTACRRRGYREVLCPTTKRPPQPPRRVRLLFISYAPPAGGDYFYDETCRDGLRLRLFRVLNRIGYRIGSIADFLSLGFFLVPTVKCPSSRNGLDAHPRAAAATLCSSRFLIYEIASLRPERICLLGTVPRDAMADLFTELKRWRGRPLKRLRGHAMFVSIGGRRIPVLPSYWPRERSFGDRYLAEDLRAFTETFSG